MECLVLGAWLGNVPIANSCRKINDYQPWHQMFLLSWHRDGGKYGRCIQLTKIMPNSPPGFFNTKCGCGEWRSAWANDSCLDHVIRPFLNESLFFWLWRHWGTWIGFVPGSMTCSINSRTVVTLLNKFVRNTYHHTFTEDRILDWTSALPILAALILQPSLSREVSPWRQTRCCLFVRPWQTVSLNEFSVSELSFVTVLSIEIEIFSTF